MLVPASAAAALLALITLIHPAGLRAQEPVALHVDVDPNGNTAISLGENDSCISVPEGETFTIDVTVTDVSTLSAWEVYFVYDPSIIEIKDRDLRMFLAAEPGSKAVNVSESLPDQDGLYRIAEADLSSPPAAESGSGVLTRLTLLAKTEGRSFAGLPAFDINEDGNPDFGPRLFAPGGQSIGDGNGDGFFDRLSLPTQIAVSLPCDEDLQPPIPDIDTIDGEPVAFLDTQTEPDSAGELVASTGGGESEANGDGGSSQAVGETQAGTTTDQVISEEDDDSGPDQTTSSEEGDDQTSSDDQSSGDGSDSSSGGLSPWAIGGISAAAVLFIVMALAFVRFARARTP